MEEGIMALEDYLLPGEEIKFQSKTQVTYGDKLYTLVVTNKRIILYARRGLVFKSDDVVTFKLDELQGIKYRETGIISKKGVIEIQGKTKATLEGPAKEMKTLYQQLLQFL
ncbi:PH domain-containing protein [Pyrococcus kukulkanii]|uniref:PH domain-containing protein n=1 Tax=Pyrococcus kukulkanii TaxID=1609559 RepID=UPI003565D9D9